MVCIGKASTFAPALREKHSGNSQLIIHNSQFRNAELIKRNYFRKGLVEQKKAVSLQPVSLINFEVGTKANKLFNRSAIKG